MMLFFAFPASTFILLKRVKSYRENGDKFIVRDHKAPVGI